MAISTKRITAEITIAGASQSGTTESIMGRIDQIILESSTPNQSADLVLENAYGDEIYRKEQLVINTILNDLRPDLLPMGAVTITISNPLNVSGTVTVTIIEKERGE